MLFDKRSSVRTSAERFESQGARAAEQINRVQTLAFGADEIENRFADAMFHRPCGRVAVIAELASTKSSTNDPQIARFCGRFFSIFQSDMLRPGFEFLMLPVSYTDVGSHCVSYSSPGGIQVSSSIGRNRFFWKARSE